MIHVCSWIKVNPYLRKQLYGTLKTIFSKLLHNDLNKESPSFSSRALENVYSRFIYNFEIMLIAKSYNAILVSSARKKDIYRFNSFSMDM